MGMFSERCTWLFGLAAVVALQCPNAALADAGPGKWQAQRSVSALTDTKGFVATLASDTPLLNQINQPETAQLVVRCVDGILATYVVWPQVVGRNWYGHTTVLTRLDGGAISSETWTISKEGTAAGAFSTDDAFPLLSRLGAARKLVVRMDADAQQDAVFELDGVEQIQAEALATCNVGNDEDFGANLTEAAGMGRNADARLLGIPDLYEVLVGGVHANSIAAIAGLHWADTIYEFNGKRFTSVEEFEALVRAVPAGSSVELKVVHINPLTGPKPVTLHAQF
jgi:hypothetical protein